MEPYFPRGMRGETKYIFVSVDILRVAKIYLRPLFPEGESKVVLKIANTRGNQAKKGGGTLHGMPLRECKVIRVE